MIPILHVVIIYLPLSLISCFLLDGLMYTPGPRVRYQALTPVTKQPAAPSTANSGYVAGSENQALRKLYFFSAVYYMRQQETNDVTII